MTGIDFDQINVGDVRSLTRSVSSDDLDAFVRLTGDDNPLHVDPDFARRTAFHEPVVHGMLGASFVSTLIGTQMPGPGALWISQSFDFLRPVRVNDTLTVTCTVREKHERDRILDLEMDIRNQDAEAVLRGTGRVRVLNVESMDSGKPTSPTRRLALITGASGGLGRAIALDLALHGHDLLLHYHARDAEVTALIERIGALEPNSKVVAVQADLSNHESTSALASSAQNRFGGVDVIVHTAAPTIRRGGVTDLSWSEASRQLDVQVRSLWTLVRALVPGMCERGWGRVVSITSDVAHGSPVEGWAAYRIAKAALTALTENIALEHGRFGVTANCVSPGLTQTTFVAAMGEKAQMVAARNTPTRRLARPEDVAGVVRYLAGDDAGQVNGQTIRVNGGARMS